MTPRKPRANTVGMAKRRTATKTRTIVKFAAPAAPARRRRKGAVKRFARIKARRFGRAARSHSPALGIALGAGLLGFAEGKGYLDKLPSVAGSRAVSLGVAGFMATRLVSNPHVRTAGVAAMAAAAFDIGKSRAGGTSGLDDGGHGDF